MGKIIGIKDKNETSEAKINSLLSQIKTLTENNEELSIEVETLKTENEELKLQIKTLTENNEELDESTDTSEDEIYKNKKKSKNE